MVVVLVPSPYDCECELFTRLTDSGLAVGSRFALATIAAFRTTENSGFMPQARHGGNGNVGVAIVGSKFEGTGLEKEQIVQTQVPPTTGAEGGGLTGGRKGLAEREPGVEEDRTL